MNVHVRLVLPLIVVLHACMDSLFLILDVVTVVKLVIVLVHHLQNVMYSVHMVMLWVRIPMVVMLVHAILHQFVHLMTLSSVILSLVHLVVS